LLSKYVVQKDQDQLRIPGLGCMGERMITIIKPSDFPLVIQVARHEAKPIIFRDRREEGLTMILLDALHRPGLQTDSEFSPDEGFLNVFEIGRPYTYIRMLFH
jgi:hypothetical protein